MTPAPSTAIALEGVGKHYWQLRERTMLLRSLLPGRGATRSELWALRDLDLVVEEGETIGVLGRNGAGKTTLLRLLAGVSQPSEGRMTLRGRVAPLIGVGVGFHHEMSGRENVYVNGMLLGLTRAEVDRRFDEIVAFAELEAFVDTPVKFYSSGMFMRLGFSVAAHVDPRILLVDEVLAVGDIAFQLKCFERMKALKEQGTTIVIVSHSMHAIRLLCPRAVLLRHGRLELDGETESVISRHHELLSVDGQAASTPEDPGASAVEIVEQAVLGADGRNVHHARQGDALRFHARLRFHTDVESPQLFFYVLAEDGTLAYEMKSVVGQRYRRYGPGEEAEVSIPFVAQLGGGTFQLTLSVTDVDARHQLAHTASGPLLYLAPPLGSAGIADLAASIEIDGRAASDHDDLTLGPRPPQA